MEEFLKTQGPKSSFSNLSEDVILHIIHKLEPDPRDWASLASVSTKFSSLIRNIFWKNKCLEKIPTIVSDHISSTTSDHPPGGWASLYKLSVCCPGLLHAGILLENSDFGLERELGPDESYRQITPTTHVDLNHNSQQICSSSTAASSALVTAVSTCSDSGNDRWSLFDDLYLDTQYDNSESHEIVEMVIENQEVEEMNVDEVEKQESVEITKQCASIGTHLATKVWNLSREQGNKLLGSRFRGDCLYICDWPGCVHKEEKRKYMLFRGIFKNFKKSLVWRTINDGNRSKIPLYCAFCSCNETWDLHSAFCLRRVFGYHEDGEPVVRAYVCENGHVSGAWTDRPMYT
ncbi:hypothetical protein C5167_014438 [Papaver somniferum]|uniref:Uncharacterized protein n=1 Tax=Papaver somniferum TaxID=3469 RepID=A0A4Y7J6A0_PAPSO|nr:phytochrome A-associated F-box protein-like [Papaver somniferum]RZC55580.1 hypothetical protein C5167_014438 [Papaver somniferum]